jgi:hypothetical protein
VTVPAAAASLSAMLNSRGRIGATHRTTTE